MTEEATAIKLTPTEWSVPTVKSENMKPTFFSLKETKRLRIIDACLKEFSVQDYENAALDRIVETAEISKGGLYEYISSKDELYLFIVEYAYQRLYDYLADHSDGLSNDILQRFRQVSLAAIDFYIGHPQLISIIGRTAHLTDPALVNGVNEVFNTNFGRLFDSVSEAGLRYPRPLLIDLMKWLLIKTRNDFLASVGKGIELESLRTQYIEEWEFLLGVLEKGVYQDFKA